jgi:VanZ family protein
MSLMKVRAHNPAASLFINFVSTSLVLGGITYLFVATTPIKFITKLYSSLHLNSFIALNDLYSIGHFVVYALVTALLAHFARGLRYRLIIVFSLVTVGLAVELIQEISGRRSFQTEDVLANILGIIAGLVVAFAWSVSIEKRARFTG